MTRKPAARKSPRRASRYSAEQVAEYRRRDAEIMDRSTTNLEDPDQVRRFARAAASGGVSTRILSYSIRNQTLLHQQAEERGFTLTDVDTLKGWRTRGRAVQKGQTGLRLVRPVGKDAPKDADADAAGNDEAARSDEAADESDTDEASYADLQEAATPRIKFRTGVVFDVAQTATVDDADRIACEQCGAEAAEACRPGCTCPVCIDPMPVDDAAETLWNNVVAQIEKAGYVMDWPAATGELHGARVHVDHDASTVHVALHATADDPDAVADLAVALAGIIARADRAADARRIERKARAAITAAPVTTA